MHEHLVGYLCGALEADEIQSIEESLARDEAFRSRLEALRRSLAPLECEREECCPPDGLAARVCKTLFSSPPPAQGFA